jgi:hypothetical protein
LRVECTKVLSESLLKTGKNVKRIASNKIIN